MWPYPGQLAYPMSLLQVQRFTVLNCGTICNNSLNSLISLCSKTAVITEHSYLLKPIHDQDLPQLLVLTARQCIECMMASLVYKSLHCLAPLYLANYLPVPANHTLTGFTKKTTIPTMTHVKTQRQGYKVTNITGIKDQTSIPHSILNLNYNWHTKIKIPN